MFVRERYDSAPRRWVLKTRAKDKMDHGACLQHRYKVQWFAQRCCYDVMLEGIAIGTHSDRDGAIALGIRNAISDSQNGIPAVVVTVDENCNEHQKWPEC